MTDASSTDRLCETPATAEIAAWLRDLAHEGAHLRLDSRDVQPGDVFVAVPGGRVDGRSFIRVAAARGASAVLLEALGREQAAERYPVAAMAVPKLRDRLGEVAAAFYGDPSADMTGVAVTGTNGKTTTAFWTSQLFTALGLPCGTIGTVGSFFGGKSFEGPELTTPDAVSLQGLYADLKRAGAKAFAVEASSVGLEQGRLAKSRFAVGIFTNLSRDHLDYHKTMEAYESAKGILFAWPGLKAAVLNADDPVSAHFAEIAKAHGIPVWATGTNGRAAAFAAQTGAAHTVEANSIRHGEAGMAFELSVDGRTLSVSVPQIGVFNVSNALGVIAAALACGFALDKIAEVLPTLKSPPGRMEMIRAPGMPLGIVDFSHTPDALEKALESLRPAADARRGRLWCVFGCGGDRDRGKRPIMGEIAGQLADRVVVTSDNPRSEDPEAIISEVAAGCAEKAKLALEADRRQAIYRAVAEAAPEDIVLVAGKGHETEQITREGAHHFSDAEVLREAFNERREHALEAREAGAR